MTCQLSLSWNGCPLTFVLGRHGVEEVRFDGGAGPGAGRGEESGEGDLAERLDVSELAELAAPGEPDQRVRQVARELEAYRAGTRKAFSIPFRFPTSTPWREAVWHELCRIPYGSVLTYREVAVRLGHPGAARAVGQACGANPLPILIPCHRVVGCGGRLGGYSGGAGMKRFFLGIEGVGLSGSGF